MNTGSMFPRFVPLLLASCILMTFPLKAEKPPQKKGGPSVYDPNDRGTRSWLLSTGDSVAVADMFPVDTPEQVRQVIANVDDLFNIQRILWRGAQSDRISTPGTLVRSSDYFRSGIFDAFIRFRERGISKAAADAATARGIEFWAMDTLTEMQNLPWVDAGKGFGGSVGAIWFLDQNPHWAPVDRIHLRKQGGMMSYAYPEARAAFLNHYEQFVIDHPYYTGFWFYSFVENFELQFEDEFGFEEPMVAEYRKRYGVDIRKEPFDKQKWYDLKGEYFTQFIREMSVMLRKHGRKMAVAIDPSRLDRPTPWLAGGASLRPTGRFTLEWKKWIKEGLIDEITLYCVGGEDVYFQAFGEISRITEGTPVKLSIYNSAALPDRWHSSIDKGLDRIMQDVPWQHRGYSGTRPLTDLDSPDPYAKLNVLHQLQADRPSGYTAMLHEPVTAKSALATVVDRNLVREKVVPLLNDSNVLVRRAAINVLGWTRDPAFLPEIEKALIHGESTVQSLAARALGLINGPNSVAAIREAVLKNRNWMLAEECVKAMGKFGIEQTAARIQECHHADAHVRYVFHYGFSGSSATTPESEAILIAGLEDPDETVGFAAAFGLQSFRTPKAREALLKTLRSANLYIASRAAVTLGNHYGTEGDYSGPEHVEIARELQSLIAQCGAQTDLRGREWAWRPLGNALYKMGPVGKTMLREFLLNNTNAWLSDRAWELLYARVDGWGWNPILEETALANYRFAQNREASQTPPPFPQASGDIIYLKQDFDSLPEHYSGSTGNYRNAPGMWLNLGEKAPAPILQKIHHRRGLAAELYRSSPGHKIPRTLEGRRLDLTLTDQKVIASAWVRLPYEQSKVGLFMRAVGPSSNAGLTLDGKGTVTPVTHSGPQTPISTSLITEEWNRIGVIYDLTAHRMEIRTGPHLETLVVGEIPLPEDQRFNLLQIAPAGALNTRVFVDDIEVTFRE